MSYWITHLNTGSTKSPYSIRFTLNTEPTNMEEISAWLPEAFGKNGYLLKITNYPAYAEIYFKSESDATSLMLRWGEFIQ